MEHKVTVQTSHPGRMAPNTAFCFLLSSVSFLLTRKKLIYIQLRGVLGSLIFGLGLVAFVGYSIGMEATYGWGEYTKMAVHTAFGFMVIGIGITTQSWQKEYSMNYNDIQLFRPWIVGYAISIALIIFLVDLSLPLGIVGGIPYIVFILFGWFLPKKNSELILAFISTLLISIAYLISISSNENWMIITNRLLTIGAIWITAFQVKYLKSKDEKLKLANQELALRIGKLESMNHELEQFTYIASHDLQEPLKTVTSIVDLLIKDQNIQNSAKTAKYLEFISRGTNRMSQLVKGLMDYSRIGNNREVSKIDCNDILKSIEEDLSVKIKETKTRINYNKLPIINGFDLEIRLLFQNLIINGIKFVSAGTNPIIIIKCEELNDRWEFSVQDNGIGIDKKFLHKIFLIFQKLHNSNEYAGTGIGLAHCKKIIELHEGKIWVESELEKGSTFHFTISKKLQNL